MGLVENVINISEWFQVICCIHIVLSMLYFFWKIIHKCTNVNEFFLVPVLLSENALQGRQ